MKARTNSWHRGVGTSNSSRSVNTNKDLSSPMEALKYAAERDNGSAWEKLKCAKQRK